MPDDEIISDANDLPKPDEDDGSKAEAPKPTEDTDGD